MTLVRLHRPEILHINEARSGRRSTEECRAIDAIRLAFSALLKERKLQKGRTFCEHDNEHSGTLRKWLGGVGEGILIGSATMTCKRRALHRGDRKY